MQKLILEVPTIYRKDDGIDFIKEFITHNSKIYGSGGLENYLDNYENWIFKLVDDCNYTNDKVPAKTFFLVRENDNKIVGIINLRLGINEEIKNKIGNIDFSIRPTERGKGYSKICLYLGLIECKKHNIDNIILSCNRENIACSRTIASLNGKKEKEIFDKNNNCYIDFYTINIDGVTNENMLLR